MTSQFSVFMEARDSLRKITVTWAVNDVTARVEHMISHEFIGYMPVLAAPGVTPWSFQAYLDAFDWDKWFEAVGHGA
jgi:hypothetical protein